MRNELIPDSAVEAAFDWLEDNNGKCAGLRAQRLYLEEYRKVLKARIMREQDADMAVNAAEREAYASKRYEEHLEGWKIAVELDEEMQYRRETNLAKISAWQTASKMRTNV
jgi:hypothetical protein